MVETNFPNLLPEGYREQIVIPEVRDLVYDGVTGFSKIIISGDVSHYKQTDNPIVEIFRAVEQKYSPENRIGITVGCPRYDAVTNLTTCNLLPNNVNSLKGEDFERASKEAFEKVRTPFEEALTAFFNKEHGGFRDHQIYHLLLNATENKDLFDELVAQCNKELKNFIKEIGYELPKRRLRQTTQATIPTWTELLRAAINY